MEGQKNLLAGFLLEHVKQVNLFVLFLHLKSSSTYEYYKTAKEKSRRDFCEIMLLKDKVDCLKESKKTEDKIMFAIMSHLLNKKIENFVYVISMDYQMVRLFK